MWLTECCIRPLHEHELVSLAKRWFRGATIVSFASHGLEGVGVVDLEGQILGNQMQAVVEIPFAGFWNMQGRILHSPWLNDDGFRWSHIEVWTRSGDDGNVGDGAECVAVGRMTGDGPVQHCATKPTSTRADECMHCRVGIHHSRVDGYATAECAERRHLSARHAVIKPVCVCGHGATSLARFQHRARLGCVPP